jgi:hypothetical protein
LSSITDSTIEDASVGYEGDMNDKNVFLPYDPRMRARLFVNRIVLIGLICIFWGPLMAFISVVVIGCASKLLEDAFVKVAMEEALDAESSDKEDDTQT